MKPATNVQATPGPWRYDGSADSLFWSVELRNGLQTREILVEGFSDVEADANARLIAAAPDLLALVRQYRDDMRHGVSEDGATRREQAIDAVLAKVEGR